MDSALEPAAESAAGVNSLRHQPDAVDGTIHVSLHQGLDVVDGLIQSARLRRQTEKHVGVTF